MNANDDVEALVGDRPQIPAIMAQYVESARRPQDETAEFRRVDWLGFGENDDRVEIEGGFGERVTRKVEFGGSGNDGSLADQRGVEGEPLWKGNRMGMSSYVDRRQIVIQCLRYFI